MSSRTKFRRRIESGDTIIAPLCLDPLTARIASEAGFGAGYVSGGALGYSYAVSEALLTLTELAEVTRRVVWSTALPIIVDGGVGFGDPVHTARAIWELEATGAAAIELEDQVAPKRVSHHRGVEHLVTAEEMCAKLRHAVEARRDPDFLIVARTGAVRNESFEEAVTRGNAYRAAGADLIMLMPSNEGERRRAPAEIAAPLSTMAAMDARPAEEWQALRWSLIIDPFTAQVLAVDVVRRAYEHFRNEGSTGHSVADLMRVYATLPDLAGLEPLFEIERQTTERET